MQLTKSAKKTSSKQEKWSEEQNICLYSYHLNIWILTAGDCEIVDADFDLQPKFKQRSWIVACYDFLNKK